MTLKDIRPFARLICEWCVEQDDLQGFDVGIIGAPYRPLVRVTLYWSNAWKGIREYAVMDVRLLEKDKQWLNNTLDHLAVEARKRAARIADPNRLPG